MAEYRPDDFITVYPGVYTPEVAEALENYIAECKPWTWFPLGFCNAL